jgi:hypothetical protein
LYEKFRNERKRSNDPETLPYKLAKKPKTDVPQVNASLRRGGIDWEPSFPQGEDETSMEYHRIFIATEWKKRSPDMEKINSRMELTYPDRRMKMNNKMPLKEIREEYPALFSYKQVKPILTFCIAKSISHADLEVFHGSFILFYRSFASFSGY